MEDQEAQFWNHIQCPEACASNNQSNVHLPCFHLGHGMRWHHALCGLVDHPRSLGNIFSEYLVKGRLPSRTKKSRCESLWGQTEFGDNNIIPQVRYKLWVSRISIRVMVQLTISMPEQQRQGTWHYLGAYIQRNSTIGTHRARMACTSL